MPSRSMGAQARVHDYAKQRPGIVLVVADVAADLELSASTVSGAFGRLAKRQGSGIKAAEGRGAYLFVGKRPIELHSRKPIAIGTLLECVGATDAGEPVVRDEEGITYVARVVK